MIFNSAHKVSSRQSSIIDAYKKVFGKSKIPKNRAYITLCAECCDKNGVMLKNNELSQLVDAGFITPEQFHGISYDEKTIEYNSQIPQCHWYCMNIREWFHFNNIQPGFVNLDCLNTLPTEMYHIHNSMRYLNPYKNVYLNVNVLVKNFRVEGMSIDAIMNMIMKDDTMIMMSHIHGWKLNQDVIEYKGKGAGTLMFSFGIYK